MIPSPRQYLMCTNRTMEELIVCTSATFISTKYPIPMNMIIGSSMLEVWQTRWLTEFLSSARKMRAGAGVHFSKNWIHVSREISQFTFHIPLIENCTWTSLTSHFSNHISYYIMYIFCFISCILPFMICEMWNGKWDSHFTFLRCQMWFVKQTWNVISFFRKMDSC